MFSNDLILSLLNYIKDNEGITGDRLRQAVANYLHLDWKNEAGYFINHIENTKKYIYHEASRQYYLTEEGKQFIKREERKKKKDKLVKNLKWIIPLIIGLVPLGIYLYETYNKPDILLLYNGKDIKNFPIILVDCEEYPQQEKIQGLLELQLLNVGIKRADNVKSYLYLDKGRIAFANNYYFSSLNELKSEKKNFKKKYQSNPFVNSR